MISGLAQWVKDLASPQAQHRLQMQIGSGVAMAVVWAGGYSSELTPNLETSICCRFSSETEREKKKKKTQTAAALVTGEAQVQSLAWCTRLKIQHC